MLVVREVKQNWNKYDNIGSIKGNGRDIPIDVWQIDANPLFGHETFYDNSDVKKVTFNDSIIDSEPFEIFLSKLKNCDLRVNKYIYTRNYKDMEIAFCFDSNAVVAFEKNEMGLLNLKDNADDYNNHDLYCLFYLYSCGFIVDCDYDEFTKYSLLRNKSMLTDNNIDSYMILPTLHCNARCFYCFENNDEKCNMNPQTINQLKAFIFNRSKGRKVVIRWFGGEPLMRADVIDELSNFLSENSIDFDAIITTNGSLITDDIISKIASSWHIRKVHLTLDGNEEEHNKRKNYKQAKINGYRCTINYIESLLNVGVYVVCRLNLDRNNIKYLNSILEDLSVYKDNPRFFAHATTLYLPKYSDFKGCYSKDEYNEVYTYTFNAMLSKGFIKSVNSVLPDKAVFRCTACMNNHYVIDPQGNLFKCEQEEKTDDHKVGNIWDGIKYTTHMGYWMDNNLSSECENCNFIPICQGGCKWRESIDNYELTPCVNTRYQMGAISDFIYLILSHGKSS